MPKETTNLATATFLKVAQIYRLDFGERRIESSPLADRRHFVLPATHFVAFKEMLIARSANSISDDSYPMASRRRLEGR